MKKIVALVLSLVMVLGLATTAFGADAKYTIWEADEEATKNATTGYWLTNLDMPVAEAAVAPVAPALNGSVAYYEIGGVKFVLGTYDDCTHYLTVKDKTTPVMYLKQIGTEDYFAAATEFTNFGKECGQCLYTPTAGVKYYSYTTAAGKTYVHAADMTAGAVNSAYYLLVDGEMVAINPTDLYNEVAHAWAYTYDAAKKPVSAKCVECGATATVYTLFTAVPAGADYEVEGNLYLVIDAPVVEAPAGDKVESAETFDAGIAMYVGMSVMAAAGSAVVLKKKD